MRDLLDAELNVAGVGMSPPNEPLPQRGQQEEEQQSTPRICHSQNAFESIEVLESSNGTTISPDAGLRAALDAAMTDSLVAGGNDIRRQSNLQDGVSGRENANHQTLVRQQLWQQRLRRLYHTAL